MSWFTRRRILVLAVVGVVIVAGILGWRWSTAVSPAAKISTPSHSAEQNAADLPCSSWTAPLNDSKTQTDKVVSIAAGVQWVRLCSLPGDKLAGTVPPEALTLNPQAVADAVNALPHPRSQACTADLGPSFALIFGYSDQTASIVSGNLGGCRTLAGRINGERALDAFLAAMTRQRATAATPIPASVPVPSCQSWGSWLAPEPGQTIRAFYCANMISTPVPVRQWAALATAITTSATVVTAQSAALPAIFAQSPDGEVVRLGVGNSQLEWTTEQGSVRQPTITVHQARLTAAQWAPIAQAMSQK